MNANDHDIEKRLDEYIDTLNAGRPAPQLAGDVELSDLFATARDLHRLRVAEAQPDDVPARLAAALERELQANPTYGTRRIESHDMNLFKSASSNGTPPPPDDVAALHAWPRRPERARQWAQFAVAAVAFIIVGVILTQIIGGGTGEEPGSAVGTDPGGSPTSDIFAPGEIVMTPAILMPTPGATLPPESPGVVRVRTLEEARDMTAFEIVAPGTLPAQLMLDSVTVYTALDKSAPEAVTAYYRHVESGEVQFWQTLGGCVEPDMVEGRHDDIAIGEKAIRRSSGTNASGESTASYRWVSGDICYTIRATLKSGVDEELIASLVLSIPLLEDQSGPTDTPVPAGPQFSTLTVSPDYVTCDDMLMAHGMNFEPGTTVVIYGGRLLGDEFGPVSVDISVGENGTIRAHIDLERLIGECGGGSEERDGNQFTLIAQTGTSLTKDGFHAEGTSAVAVLSFSRNVPEGVKQRERLPSCGTEVILNATMLSDGGTARECFAAAVELGAVAEFIAYHQTNEGDIVTTIYNSLGNQDVDVIVDGTQDRFGSGTWQRSTCVWNEMSNLEPYTFQYEYCSEPITIE